MMEEHRDTSAVNIKSGARSWFTMDTTDRTSKHEAARACCLKFMKVLRTNALVIAMLVGVLVGVILGVSLNTLDPKLTKVQIAYLRFPGVVFIQMMQLLIIPIVVSSLLCSVAEIDIRSSGKIGLRALVYYIGTMLLASLMGVTMALTIRPGERMDVATNSAETKSIPSSSPGLALMDLIRNMVPDNLIEACFTSKKTSVHLRNSTRVSASNQSTSWSTNNAPWNNETLGAVEEVEYVTEAFLQTEKVGGVNALGLVVASITFGAVTSAAGAEAKPFLDFFKAFRCVSFRLVTVLIWFSPVGICFLVAPKLAEMDDPTKTIVHVALYIAGTVTGFAVHGFLVLSLLYLIIVRKNPLRFISGMFPALLFAFGSASSSATLPLTIKCLEEKNGVDPRVTKLIASVGATINMDGACVFYNFIGIFVAQVNGITLDAGQLVTLCLLSVSIAAGSAGIPTPGSSYTFILLAALGLPLHDIGPLLAVGWFVERCETSINVLGDAFGAGIIEHLSRNDLRNVTIPATDKDFTDRDEPNEIGIPLTVISL